MSKKHERAVSQYLIDNIKMPISGFVAFNSEGEAHDWDDTTVQGEHEEGRCVRVAIHRPGIKPPIVPLPPSESKEFKIRMLWDISFSGPKGVTAERTTFEILDIRREKAASYTYTGGGLGVPVPKIKVPVKLLRRFPWTKKMPQIEIVPGSSVLTLVGDSSDFKTSKPARFRYFEGEAHFTQGPAAGPFALFNWLSFHNRWFLRKEMSHNPPRIEIKTGFTFGINILSGTVGHLDWDETEHNTILPWT